MSVVAANPQTSPFVPERSLTISDIAALPAELPSGPVLYELDNGRLIIMAPPGDVHAAVESNVVTELKIQLERKGLGKARSGEVGIVLRRNPDRLVGADAAFICNDRLPLRTTPEGYLETIPDLVVEVRSKNDRAAEVSRKVAEYLAAGVRLVWVFDPQAQTVTAHRQGEEPRVFSTADTLTADDVVPGFSVSVAELFRI